LFQSHFQIHLTLKRSGIQIHNLVQFFQHMIRPDIALHLLCRISIPRHFLVDMSWVYLSFFVKRELCQLPR